MIPSEDYCMYEVKPGDSLSAIAAHFGHITPTQLAKINRLSAVGCGLPPVFPGQKILVPTSLTGKVTAPRIRRAPGSAHRVSGSPVESWQIVGSDQTAQLQRSTSEFTSLKEDPSEKQFVKVFAERMLTSGELVDGVLLITPDCLCFDATQMAIAQTQASDSRRSSAVSSTGSTRLSDPMESSSLAGPTSELSLCVPLERLRSMTTMKLSESQSHVCSEDKSSANGVRLSHSDPHDSKVLLPSGSLAVGLEPAESKPDDLAVSSSPVETSSESVTVSRPPSSSTERLQDSSTPDHRTDVVSSRPNSPRSTHSTHSLLLQLTEIAAPGESPKQYCFLIKLNDIPLVFAFLLDLGVKGKQDRKSADLPQSPASSKRKKSGGSSDHEYLVVHRSLIEEALEDLETVPLTPAVYGGESGILSKDMLTELGGNFPTHWIGANIRLIYRSDHDGYSLGTLYRKSKDVEGGVILLIRDTMNTVFGAIMSERPRCSQHFYGTGETCVFHWSPRFKRYDWTKKNYFFMLGSISSFQIGGQSGRNAIWIDEALKYGRSEPTDTFDNPVLSGCLPAMRFDSQSAQATEAISLMEDQDSKTTPADFRRSCSQEADYHHLTGGVHSPSLESVPFVIDTLELWELLS